MIGAVETSCITAPDILGIVIFEGVMHGKAQAGQATQDINRYRFRAGASHRTPQTACSYPLGRLAWESGRRNVALIWMLFGSGLRINELTTSYI